MSHLSPVRGRDGDIEAIHAALDRVRRGVGDVTLIEGQPGIGKTRLLTEGRSIAERLGFRTGLGAGRPGEGIVELSALMDAICGGSAPLVDFTKLSKLVGSPEQRYWVLQDVQSLLERAAMQTPLMVCLDGTEIVPGIKRNAALRTGRAAARPGMLALRSAGQGREGPWATAPLHCRRWMGPAVSSSAVTWPASSASAI